VRRDVTPDERLSDGLGLDSLTASEVLMAIGEELGWTVPLAWWFEASNLADLARLIERRPAAGGEVDALAARDLELAVPVDPAALPPSASMDRVLLTGATGLLGAHLLEDLVQRTRAHIVCLVRAPDAAAAAERVRSTLATYRIPALDPARWSVIAGDLASPRLGLDDAAWAAIEDEIDAVVHAGASVNWISVYQKLREPNVLGTLALLELAAARRRKPFHYVSTIGTAPVDGDETTSLSFDQAHVGSAYGLTKWIAEQLVGRAGEAGHPVTVHRPGMITGHSTRGFGNADDYVHRYLRACLHYGRYLDRPERLDMTPVDYVSRAIVALLLDAPGGGGAHHLCNVDQSMTYAELGRALIEAGAQCEPADYATFRAAAVLPKDSPLRPLAAYFPESAFSLGTGPWPSSATRARLASLSVRCPVIDAPLIARYLAGLRHLGRSDLSPGAG
jgi:thioester reductase-like protein